MTPDARLNKASAMVSIVNNVFVIEMPTLDLEYHVFAEAKDNDAMPDI